MVVNNLSFGGINYFGFKGRWVILGQKYKSLRDGELKVMLMFWEEV